MYFLVVLLISRMFIISTHLHVVAITRTRMCLQFRYDGQRNYAKSQTTHLKYRPTIGAGHAQFLIGGERGKADPEAIYNLI